MKFTLRHDLPCTADAFWEAYFDPDVQDAMFREAMGCTEVVIEEQTGDLETGIHRVMRTTQPLDAPGPVRKVVGETATTTETGDYADGVWTFTAKTNMGDKVKLSGRLEIEPKGETCTRVFDMDIQVKILGVGKMIETTIEKQTRTAQDNTATWLAGRLG